MENPCTDNQGYTVI